MSVPETQRGEGVFEVTMKARELAVYTLQICDNKNVFKPEHQSSLTDKLISEATDIFINCFTANEIRVAGDQQAYLKRRFLQEVACEHCNTLLALMQIAKPLFHLETKRIKYWGSMTVEVRNKIRKWMESDKKRFTA